MSQKLRRCLSLALVFMLLASLSVNGAINVSADEKTGAGLAAYAMTAYNEGWSYVWGGASYGAVDCSGLIYSYVGGGARVTEDQLYSSPESGYVSDGVPDIPGLGLWQPGHVGVYVGGGMAVDARDEISNVCYQSVSTKNWVMWFKVAGVSYGTTTSVAKEDKSEESNENSKPATPSFTALQLGSTGSDVNKLQERLKELGYFDDDTTEYFGYVTLGALKEFQLEAGLSATGIFDEDTKAALEAADAPSKPTPKAEKEVDTQSDEPDSEESQEVLFDSEGAPVDVPDDAQEPEDTTADISQNIDENDEDEQADPEADGSDTAGLFMQFDEYDTEEQSSANGSSEDDSKTADDVVYSMGDEAAEISDIQYVLIKLGYFDCNITGTYCENTADAVEEFRNDFDLGDERTLNEETITAIYSVFNGTYTSKSDEKKPLNTAAEEESTEDTQAEQASETVPDTETAADSESDGQSVTFTLTSTDTEEPAAAEAKTDAADTASDKPQESAPAATAEAAATTTGSAAPAQTPKAPVTASSGGESVVFVETGVEDYFSMTFALIVIGVSLIIIFFAGTIHYWNVSMEKRRQRARRATTVSVYHRSSM